VNFIAYQVIIEIHKGFSLSLRERVGVRVFE